MPSLQRRNRSLPVILALTLAILPGAASAATLTIVPEKFLAMNINDSAAIDPWAMTSGDAGAATFTTSVKIPVGATVTQLLYYHWGNGAGSTRVALYRTKMGQPFDVLGADYLMVVTSSDAVPITVPPQIVSTTSPQNPASDLVVRPGYRYFLVATCSNGGNWINGVKISFNP